MAPAVSNKEIIASLNGLKETFAEARTETRNELSAIRALIDSQNSKVSDLTNKFGRFEEWRENLEHDQATVEKKDHERDSAIKAIQEQIATWKGWTMAIGAGVSLLGIVLKLIGK